MMNRKLHPEKVFYVGTALSTVLFLILMAVPYLPCIPMVLPNGPLVFLVANPALNHILLILCLLLPAITLLAHSRIAARTTSTKSSNADLGSQNSGLRSQISPLALLPLSFIGYFLPCLFGTTVSANLLFYLPLLFVTLALLRLTSRFSGTTKPLSNRRTALFLLCGLTAIYTLSGFHVSSQIGEHAVDEGHYLMQAESLYRDHDLDIRNNFGFDVDDAVSNLMKERTFADSEREAIRRECTANLRDYLHVSRNSRDDHWYSWHPYGISILLAPVSALDMPGRQLALALIAAFGCMVTFLLCEEISGSRPWSLLLTLLLALSSYWFVYSIRALPEVLGATLFVTAIYSTFLAKRCPLRSFCLLMICTAFMVVAHPRFAPCALLATGYYFANVLFIIPFSRKARLTYLACLVLGVLSGTGYLLANYFLFEGSTSYLTHGLFWAYPEGGWLILFSERGLFYSLPASIIMVIALGYALATDRKHLLLHLVALAALLGMMLSIGTADCWDGGPTMAGRYLVVVIPLLMPATALLTKRSSTWGKGWILLLFVSSAAYTFPCLFNMNDIGAGFLHKPLYTIKQGLPLLRELFHPYFISDIMIGHPYHGLDAFTTHPFPILLLAISVFLIVPRRIRTAQALPALLLFLILSAYLHNLYGSPDFSWPPQAVEAALSQTPLAHARVSSCDNSKTINITDYSNRFDDFRSVSITLDDLGQRERDGVFSQRYLDANGWENKDYRWYTLTAPFKSGSAGPHKLTIEGTTSGALDTILAVKEGRHVLTNQIIEQAETGVLSFSTILDAGQHRGDTYILLRLEGPGGTLTINRVGWTPIPEGE